MIAVVNDAYYMPEYSSCPRLGREFHENRDASSVNCPRVSIPSTTNRRRRQNEFGAGPFFLLLVSWLATSANCLGCPSPLKGGTRVMSMSLAISTLIPGFRASATTRLSSINTRRHTNFPTAGSPETPLQPANFIRELRRLQRFMGTLKIMKCNQMVHGKVQMLFFFWNWSSKSSSKILRVHDFFYAIYFLVAVCLEHGWNTGRPEFRWLYHGTVTLRPHTRSQLVWYDSMTLRYLKKNVGAHKILRDKEHQRLPVLDVLRKSCSLQICFSTSQTCRCRS